jgi:hypothetical protein
LSILDEKALNDLKWNYNYNLGRYYNGCKYCSEHKKEVKKWLPELLDILDNINRLMEEIMKYETVDKRQIEFGFVMEEQEEK